jgi:methylthioribose-1-phosphate isomerase
MDEYFTIRLINGTVRMLDQRLLPQQEVYRDYSTYQGVAQAVIDMVIRGAPAIGAAAGYGMALAAISSTAKESDVMMNDLIQAAKILQASRPTAINLSWAVKRILKKALEYQNNVVTDIQQAVIREAIEIAEEDVRINKRIAKNGFEVVPDEANIIHHCNTGSLATVSYGTALGVIRYAFEHGKNLHVYVDETRPRLQGARLTSWELMKLGIPHTVIVDGASGHFMRTQKIDLCLVGCDRIAANGDVANKIGTYNLALAAFAHRIPFYSVGPISTIDMETSSGDDIPIEERSADEISRIGDCSITPFGVQIANPAFDVTPSKYISAIITERGIAKQPYNRSLSQLICAEAESKQYE